MTREEIVKVLTGHTMWLDGRGGNPANLPDANLPDADLQGANLRGANLPDANLRGANLRGANLRGANLPDVKLQGANLQVANLPDVKLQGANLQGANLRGANLRGANLRGADLLGANLPGANLRGANLQDADLQGANLQGAILQGANLQGADLRGANLPDADLRGAMGLDGLTVARLSIVPAEGPVIGWKKCRDDVIVKLRIPDGVARSNATGRKCRAERVEVLQTIGAAVGVSSHKPSITYAAGATVVADEWEQDRWVECGGGIHFFITREEAEAYPS